MSWGFAFRLRQRLKGSLWVLPFLGAVLGPVLGLFVQWLDGTVQVPEAWQYSASTATSVLSVLVGAMVALLGFVVTIGVLVVQQATGTLSPRFMRLWYQDLLQKVVLATFAGTLTFSFWLLRHVEEGSVPNIGVTVAGAAAAASLLLLLAYLNRFTHLLRPVAVAAAVARAGRRVVASSPVGQAVSEDPDGGLRGVLSAKRSMVVRVDRPGAIQAVHLEGLVAVARRFDCVLVLHRAVGAGLGALMGKVEKSGIDQEFQRQVRDMLKPGTSALFLVVEKVTPDKAMEALSRFGGTVLKSSLSKETEQELQKELAGQSAAS